MNKSEKIGFVCSKCSQCQCNMNGYDGPICKECNKINNDLYNMRYKSWISNNRRYYKRDITFSHIVWNTYNPDNMITKGGGYVIHHKDENSLNDDISNLQKMTRKEHTTLHHKGKTVSEITRKILSKINKNKKQTEESNRKNSESHKGEKNHFFGKKHSEETKDKISKTRKERGISKGKNNPMYGVRLYGKDNPNWKGGISKKKGIVI